MGHDVISFAQRSRRARSVRGIVLILDTSINEVLYATTNGQRYTAAVDARDITDALQNIIKAKDPAMWVECEVVQEVVTQLFLVADGAVVQEKLSCGCYWNIEEDVVQLCKSAWREARVPCPQVRDNTNEVVRDAGGVQSETTCKQWKEDMALFDHQTQTVSWMRSMEDKFPMCISYGGNIRISSEWFVDTESECFTRQESPREAHLIGGICADGMGKGKTASILRLIVETIHLPLVTAQHEAYATRATLIILPLNLVGQWKREIEKFLDKSLVTVYFVVQGKDLPTMSEVLGSDIVVTTFQFLRSNKVYGELADRCLNGRSRERSSLSAWARVPNREECLLEAVLWRRVVVDEIHHTFERMADMRHVRLFKTRALWGLSATPSLHNDQAQHLYALLLREKAHHPNLLAALISHCVRNGTSSESPSQEKRSLHIVSLSAEERILMSDSAGDTLAEKVRKVTFVDVARDKEKGIVSQVSLQRQRESDAMRMKVEGHQRNVRILETVAAELEQNMARLASEGARDEAQRSAQIAYETHKDDLAAAKSILQRQLSHLRQRLAADESIQNRVHSMEVEASCGACGHAGAQMYMLSTCLHMVCSSCLNLHSVCGVCGEMFRDAFEIESTRGVGTKMREIVALIESLHGEPCILFVQWKGMMKVTRSFLKGVGVVVHTLEGNSRQRVNALQTLNDTGGVLLLCLEDGFAGLHLPYVSHIIFAHAIVGDRDRVMMLEKQAVARCLRYGQTQEVKTYSFIVANTEECVLYDRTHE